MRPEFLKYMMCRSVASESSIERPRSRRARTTPCTCFTLARAVGTLCEGCRAVRVEGRVAVGDGTVGGKEAL